MALTVVEGDATIKLKTSEGWVLEGARGTIAAIVKGTSGVTSVLFLKNSQGEVNYITPADAQNAWVHGTTRPA